MFIIFSYLSTFIIRLFCNFSFYSKSLPLRTLFPPVLIPWLSLFCITSVTTTSNTPSTLYCNWASGSGWRLTSMLTVHPPESWPQILNEPQRSEGLPHCPKPTHPLYPHHCFFYVFSNVDTSFMGATGYKSKIKAQTLQNIKS